MNESRFFFNYQYRKDIIDKFNISSVFELQLPIGIRLSKRVNLMSKPKQRRFRLLYSRTMFETLSGQGCAIRKIKKSSRVRSGVKINKHHHFILFYCDLVSYRVVFNFINLLFCILKFNTHVNFKYRFDCLQFFELGVFKNVKDRCFFFLPRHKKIRDKKTQISFFLRKKPRLSLSSLILKRILFAFFLQRLQIIRGFIKTLNNKPQIIR